MTANKYSDVSKLLLIWFKENRREFPWRKKKINLFKILIYEIFLWKTRADTVSKYICGFIEKYPDPLKIRNQHIKSLEKDIKVFGLSNRRAKLLKKVFSSFDDSRVPQNEKDFRGKYGVGQYISRSVLTIIFEKKLFPVDQNIARFFVRVFDHKIANIRKLNQIDEQILMSFMGEFGKEIIWAVIDYSSLVCKAKNPYCSDCVIRKFCSFYNANRFYLSGDF